MVQKHVRGFLQLRKFRRETEAGRRAAARAAAEAEAAAAAVTIQAALRRVLAARKVSP